MCIRDRDKRGKKVKRENKDKRVKRKNEDNRGKKVQGTR